MAAIVHDIGKLLMPAEILNKSAKLTEMEFSQIKKHTQTGYDILKDIDFPWPIARMVWQHHERLDGSGYPLGLTGEEILPEARILAVADVVEAMASHRAYRPAPGLEKALEEIQANRGRLYDPAVVDACIRIFTEKDFRLA
jgi:putative two-component system response regulator